MAISKYTLYKYVKVDGVCATAKPPITTMAKSSPTSFS
jgi:hypothetical protein